MARNMYEEYYMNQAGYGLPYYTGTPYMKGYGLGGILSGVLRSVVPMFKSAGKTLLREGLKTGTAILSDTLEGKNIKDAASQRISQSAKQLTHRATRNLVNRFNNTTSQTSSGRKFGEGVGTGGRVNRKRKKVATVKKHQTKRRKRDIFS